MLALRALGLMKTILLGIGVAAILIFGGQMLGLVDVAHMSVKGAYWGVLIGGMLLGFGWALSGFCPGNGRFCGGFGPARQCDGLILAGGLSGAAA